MRIRGAGRGVEESEGKGRGRTVQGSRRRGGEQRGAQGGVGREGEGREGEPQTPHGTFVGSDRAAHDRPCHWGGQCVSCSRGKAASSSLSPWRTSPPVGTRNGSARTLHERRRGAACFAMMVKDSESRWKRDGFFLASSRRRAALSTKLGI